MAKAIFFCGLACSGKSTLARFLESRLPAVRYSADELMLLRHNLSLDDEDFGPRLREIREECWTGGRRDLEAGKDVLFDWNLWSRARRSDWCGRVLADGHSPYVIFLDLPLEVLSARLAARNRNLPAAAHHIPLEELRRFAPFMEPPSEVEGVVVLRAQDNDSPETILRWLRESA